MIKVNTREARIKLSDLLTEAEHGETIAIPRRGQVVAHPFRMRADLGRFADQRAIDVTDPETARRDPFDGLTQEYLG